MKQIFGKSLVLSAEKQVGTIGVNCLAIGVGCFCSVVEEASSLILFKEISKVFIVGNIQQVPVIEARSFKLSVVNFKPYRFYYMESCAC